MQVLHLHQGADLFIIQNWGDKGFITTITWLVCFFTFSPHILQTHLLSPQLHVLPSTEMPILSDFASTGNARICYNSMLKRKKTTTQWGHTRKAASRSQIILHILKAPVHRSLPTLPAPPCPCWSCRGAQVQHRNQSEGNVWLLCRDRIWLQEPSIDVHTQSMMLLNDFGVLCKGEFH